MLNIGLVVASDRLALSSSEDAVGPAVSSIAEKHGFKLAEKIFVPNDRVEIMRAVLNLVGKVDVVVVSGGTGVGPRDVSVEAVLPLLEKVLPGFGEAFRAESMRSVGPRAVLSRCVAGILGGSLVCVLPGKPEAVAEALDKLVLPVAAHALEVARGYTHWGKAQVEVASGLTVEDAVNAVSRALLKGEHAASAAFVSRVKGEVGGRKVRYLEVRVSRDSLRAAVERASEKYGTRVFVLANTGLLRPGEPVLAAVVQGGDRGSVLACLGVIVEEFKRIARHRDVFY